MIAGLPTASVYGGGSSAYPWPPPKRAPLPPGPPITASQGDRIVWASAAYRSTLPFTPPAGPDAAFYRGNFCGTRVPGLDWRPGMGGNPSTGPTLCMDLDVAKYSPGNTAAWDLIITAKYASGVTHIQISLADFAQAGWSIQQTVDYAMYLKARGFFIDVFVLGGAGGWGGWGVRDSMWAQNAPLVTPWVEAFIAAGAIDWITLGWQLDAWLSGDACVDNIIGLGKLIAGRVRFYSAHWITDANAWWDDDTNRKYGINDRFDFWAFMAAHPYGLNRTHMQYSTEAPISAIGLDGAPSGGAQGAIRDACRALKPGQKLVVFENAGQDAFDNPDKRPEISGDERGWYGLCAGPELGGFGNGCRRPDGSAL